MSCCGSQRASLRQEWSASGRGDAQAEPQAWATGPIEFEYSGYGELTVTGPSSGTIYSFTAENRRVRVEGADAPSIITVPGLRPVI